MFKNVATALFLVALGLLSGSEGRKLKGKSLILLLLVLLRPS